MRHRAARRGCSLGGSTLQSPVSECAGSIPHRSWSKDSTIRRTPRPGPELCPLGPRTFRDWPCSKSPHLSDSLDRDRVWDGCWPLRRGVRDTRADLSRQGKRSNHDALVWRFLEHDLLAAQRLARWIDWLARCVFPLRGSAALHFLVTIPKGCLLRQSDWVFEFVMMDWTTVRFGALRF